MGNRKFEFELRFYLGGRDLTEAEFDALYVAGFNNSLIGKQKGVHCIDVIWEAATKTKAVTEAKDALKRTIPGAIIPVD